MVQICKNLYDIEPLQWVQIAAFTPVNVDDCAQDAKQNNTVGFNNNIKSNNQHHLGATIAS